MESDNALLIAREQTRLAYGTWVQYVDGIPFALGLAILMSGAVPAVGDAGVLAAAGWLFAALSWAAGASLAARNFFKNESAHGNLYWRIVLSAIWVAHALVWGSAVLVFWDASNPANQAVLCTVVLAIMVSYFYGLAPCFPVLLAAMLAIAGLVWVQFLICRGTLSYVFIVALPLFVLVLLNYGREASAKYRSALRVRFEKEAMAAALKTASEAKSSFLAGMSHELRTPLNAILGYADLMRQETFGPISPARYSGYLDDIHASGEHLLKLINDLLDLAKIEAGKKEFHFVPVRLGDVIDEAIKLVEPQSRRARVDIMADKKADITIEADERAVKQIVTNLLSNAVKFSHNAGIAVVYCEKLGDGGVALGVKDMGIGMTQEEQLRAVEPFMQGRHAYTVEGRGTGLGLPIVKGLAEAHGGSLHIESTAGRGSKIWVAFPGSRLLRAREAAAADEPRPARTISA